MKAGQPENTEDWQFVYMTDASGRQGQTDLAAYNLQLRYSRRRDVLLLAEMPESKFRSFVLNEVANHTSGTVRCNDSAATFHCRQCEAQLDLSPVASTRYSIQRALPIDMLLDLSLEAPSVRCPKCHCWNAVNAVNPDATGDELAQALEQLLLRCRNAVSDLNHRPAKMQGNSHFSGDLLVEHEAVCIQGRESVLIRITGFLAQSPDVGDYLGNLFVAIWNQHQRGLIIDMHQVAFGASAEDEVLFSALVKVIRFIRQSVQDAPLDGVREILPPAEAGSGQIFVMRLDARARKIFHLMGASRLVAVGGLPEEAYQQDQQDQLERICAYLETRYPDEAWKRRVQQWRRERSQCILCGEPLRSEEKAKDQLQHAACVSYQP